MTDVAGKTAFVTGGASGLGFATARALAAKGASVVLADIDAGRVEEAAATLRSEGANALGLQLDVTSAPPPQMPSPKVIPAAGATHVDSALSGMPCVRIRNAGIQLSMP